MSTDTEQADYVAELLNSAPPLSPAQLDRIGALFDYTPPQESEVA
jgi:hypothetical protein